VTKAGKAWSWLAERVRGSESSRKDGPPYSRAPQIPVPTVRKKARYSIVIMSDSGSSRQILLTSRRIKVALAVTTGVVIVVALGLMGLMGLLGGDQALRRDRDSLALRVKALEEELRKNELAKAVKEKRVEEVRQSPTLVTVGPRPTQQVEADGEDQAASEGPLTPLPTRPSRDILMPGQGADARARLQPAPDTEIEAEGSTSPGMVSRSGRAADASAALRSRAIVSFDAKDLSAVPKSPTEGTIKFTLFKDQPAVRFAGYLFVFVEMGDARGESILRWYPKRAALGDGDLPKDYREGEGIALKSHTRVELSYSDVPAGARLKRLSILLYGEDGNVVYQRGFDRREVEFTKEPTTGGKTTQEGGARRRQPL